MDATKLLAERAPTGGAEASLAERSGEEEPVCDAVALREQDVKDLYAAVSAARQAERGTGLVDSAGNCVRDLETYVGSMSAVTHHLGAGCVKLRSQRIYRFVWRTPGLRPAGSNSSDPAMFARGGSRRACRYCVSCRPEDARVLGLSLLHTVVKSLAEVAMTFERHDAGEPDLLGISNRLAEASRALDGFDRMGIGSLDQVRDALVSGVEVALRAVERESDRTEKEVPELPQVTLRELAAASAALPVSSYRISPNPAGRALEALCDRGSRGDSDARLTTYACGQVFDQWFKLQKESDVTIRWGRAEALSVTQKRSIEDLASTAAITQVNRWVITPDLTSGPWDLAEANWRELASRELELLFGDWADHFEWVLGAPDEACWLLVHYDGHASPGTTEVSRLDRYDLFKTLASRYPLRQLPTESMYAMRVPVAAARALASYAVSGVQTASLEGVDGAQVAAVAETAAKLAEGYDGHEANGWLASASAAAVAVLA